MDRLPAHAEAPLTSTDTDSWEPPASVKGDIARALFYMAVRYTGDVSSEPALYLTDATVQITSTTNLMGRFSTLLRWSQADPVDASEQLRNDRVYSYQTNRSPFMDRPEWIAAAFIPALSIARVSNAITLTWTNEDPAMSAEQSTGLASAWAAVTNAPALTASNTWAIALPLKPGRGAVLCATQPGSGSVGTGAEAINSGTTTGSVRRQLSSRPGAGAGQGPVRMTQA